MMMKKTTKKSKKVTPSNKLKKYEEGGKEVTGLKKNSEYDSKMPSGVTMPKRDMPYGTGMKMLMKTEPTTNNLKKIEMPEGSLPVTPSTPVTPTKGTKVSTPKTKLLPGGFTSEAQKKVYTQSLRDKVKSGMSVDELVKKGYGTKKGLTELGLGKYSEGVALKKKGQEQKAQGIALKNKASSTDYKKQWNDNLLSKSVTNKKLTDKEQSYIVRKYGHENLGGFAGASANDNLTPKQKKAYDNVRKAQLEKAKPKMREELEGAVQMMTPRGIAKQVIKKAGQFAFTEGAKKFIGQGTKQTASKGSQKLLGEGVKSVAKTGSKALKPDKIIKPVTKSLNSGQKMLGRTINVSGRTVSSGSQKALNSGQKLLNNGQTKLNAGQKLLGKGTKKVAAKTTKASSTRGTKATKQQISEFTKKTGRTKKEVEAFHARNKKAIDNDWAIIDSYRRGGKTKIVKKSTITPTKRKPTVKVIKMTKGGIKK